MKDDKTYIDGVADLDFASEALKVIYNNYTIKAEYDPQEVLKAMAVGWLGMRRLLASIGKDKEDLFKADLLESLPGEVRRRCRR